ncbi:MAG: type II secretion system F family protein [Armatimonadetes bacterium]|nr:type II secretion system F family protein [Armatimonadota bacterium]
MQAYQYTGRDAAGSIVRGIVEAENDARARARLRGQGLFVTSLTARSRSPLLSWLGSQPGLEDVAGFTFHMASLLSAGVPMLRALQVLGEQTESRAMREVIEDLEAGIGSGQSLSNMLSRHPELFSPLYLGIVRTGEVAGALDQALLRLSDYLDREIALQQKIRMMLVYPAFVLTMAVIVTGLFMAFVIPAFERVYRSAHAELPLPTQILVNASHLILGNWLAGVVLAPVGAWILGLPQVRRRMRGLGERLTARIPRFSAIVRTVQISRFVRTFGAMHASGVPVLTALDVTKEALPDPQMQAAIDRIKDGINRGRRLSETMRSVGLFPAMVHRMVAMGEESGRLEPLLQRASEVLDREIDHAIKRFITLAEPLLVLGLGGVVGGVLLALYLPLFGLANVLLR